MVTYSVLFKDINVFIWIRPTIMVRVGITLTTLLLTDENCRITILAAGAYIVQLR